MQKVTSRITAFLPQIDTVYGGEPIFDFVEDEDTMSEYHNWLLDIKNNHLPPISKAAQDVESVIFWHV